MAVIFQSDFNVAANTTLPQVDAKWIDASSFTPASSLFVSSAQRLAGNGVRMSIYNEAHSQDYAAAASFYVSASGGDARVILRQDAASNTGYSLRYSAGKIQIIKTVSGAGSLLGNGHTVADAVGESYDARAEVEGTTLRLYVGGTLIETITDAGIASGYCGIYINSTKAQLNSVLFETPGGAPDTTAPTLTSPSATATGATTASGSVSTNEANGTLYYLASANATELLATVKSGSSQAVTAIGAQPVTVIGLTASTPYYLHFAHTDAAANDSAVETSAQFTTDAPSGDTDPPALTGAVTFASITQTSYTASWPAGSDNVAVTGYEYQIGSTAGAWTDAGNSLSTAITGRTAGTTETVYVRAYDAAGLRSTPAISGSVTLLSVVAGIAVTEPLKNNTGTVLASQSGIRAVVLQAADLVSVFETSGLTTNASGLLSQITDAAIVTGQQYHVAIKLADGGVGITGPITAS